MREMISKKRWSAPHAWHEFKLWW